MADADLILLDRYRSSGDEEAFAELVKRYAPMVYAAGLRVLGDRGRAEDVAQETFFQLLRKPDAASSSLGGWLHRVATQRAIDVLRSETARRLREKFRGQETIDRKQADTWSDLSPMIDEAMAQLDDAERDLLVRHFLQGESQNDIAVTLDTSPATVSRRMKSAVESLRHRLDRMGVTANLSVVAAVLHNSHATEVPAHLAAELGKMSLVSGAPGITGGAAGTSGGFILGLSSGALVTTAGIVAVAGLVWLAFDELAAPPATTNVTINASEDITTTGSASVSVEARASGNASVSTRVTTTGGARFITLDPGVVGLHSDRIASFQDPATATDNVVQVVYGDGHVVSMTVEQLNELVQKQHGRLLDELLRQNKP